MSKVEKEQVSGKIHKEFHKLLVAIQTSRIVRGKESANRRVPLWRLTKTIYNMINSNRELFDQLVEVDINVKY